MHFFHSSFFSGSHLFLNLWKVGFSIPPTLGSLVKTCISPLPKFQRKRPLPCTWPAFPGYPPFCQATWILTSLIAIRNLTVPVSRLVYSICVCLVVLLYSLCRHGLGCLSRWPSHFTKDWLNGFSASWESSLGFEPRTFSYQGSCATNTLLAICGRDLTLNVQLFQAPPCDRCCTLPSGTVWRSVWPPW